MITFKQYLADEQIKHNEQSFAINEVREAGQRELKKLADKLDVEYSTLVKMPQQDIKTILHYVGRHDYAQDSEFDSNELNKGIKVEMEHTNNKLVAELIAKDHLSSDARYYSKLAIIEPEEFKDEKKDKR